MEIPVSEHATSEPYGPFPETADVDQPMTLPMPYRLGKGRESARFLAGKQLIGLLRNGGQVVTSRVSRKLRRLRRWIVRTPIGSAILTRFRRSPRTAGILVGALIIAAVLMFWRKNPDAKDVDIATADTEWKLDDVKVYAPNTGKPAPAGGREPQILQTSEIAAKSLTNESVHQSAAQPMPDTPRPVWLTGVIEDIGTESGVKRVGHVELPMEHRNRPVEQAPQFPPYRRR